MACMNSLNHSLIMFNFEISHLLLFAINMSRKMSTFVRNSDPNRLSVNSFRIRRFERLLENLFVENRPSINRVYGDFKPEMFKTALDALRCA